MHPPTQLTHIVSEIQDCLGRPCNESDRELVLPQLDLHTSPGFAEKAKRRDREAAFSFNWGEKTIFNEWLAGGT